MMVHQRDMSINDYTLAEESALIVNIVNPLKSLNECIKLSISDMYSVVSQMKNALHSFSFLFLKYDAFVILKFLYF